MSAGMPLDVLPVGGKVSQGTSGSDFPETELRQGHHITMGICTWGRSWGWMSLEAEGGWFY